MDKQKVIESLNLFKERLTGEVVDAYQTRGSDFGRERFNTWRRKFSQFLDENLPGETSVLNAKLTHYGFVVNVARVMHRGSGVRMVRRCWHTSIA